MMQRRQRQTLIAAIAAAIGVILIATVLWLYTKQFRLLSYANEPYGFSLKYPAAWSLAENKGGAAAIFYSPPENALDRFQENVNIVVQDISQNPMDLSQYTETAIHQMQIVFGTNLEILDSSPVAVDGRPGHQFEFIGKGPDGNLHYLCRWTLVNTSAYQITYTALASGYAKHLSKAQRIMNSFKIH